MTVSSKLSLISVGGNAALTEEDCIADLNAAIAKLVPRLNADRPAIVSSFYRTPAYPVGIGPDFVNAAVAIWSEMTPDAILDALHQIESEAGRIRTERWGKRPVDLDLIAVGQLVLPHVKTQSAWRGMSLDNQRDTWPTELILPHPRVQDRAFVLIPLADVAPDWVHPVTHRSVRQMCDALDADQLHGIERIV